ncbi:MAG: hypothetical protein ACJAT7_001315 [Psychromonas sp.]|jgi:hypothetical protein
MYSMIKKIAGYGNTKASLNYEASSPRSISSVPVNTYRYY